MEEFLIFLVQIIVEGLAQSFIYMPFDSVRYGDRASDQQGGCAKVFAYLIIGGALGGLSVLISPHLLLPTSALRLANFVTAPILAGTISWWAAKGRCNRRSHFWTGLSFGLAFSGVRLAYANR